MGRVAAARASAAGDGPASTAAGPSADAARGAPRTHNGTASWDAASSGGVHRGVGEPSTSSSGGGGSRGGDGGVHEVLESVGGPPARGDNLDDPFAALKYAFSGWVPAWRHAGGSAGARGRQGQGAAGKGRGEGPGGEASHGAVGEGEQRGVAADEDAGRGSQGGRGRGRAGLGPVSFEALPEGWWRGLPRVHYANFGARLGILPRLAAPSAAVGGHATEEAGDGGGGGMATATVAATSSSGSGGGSSSSKRPAVSIASGTLGRGVIVAFEDAADAEYVASSLRVGMARRAGRWVIVGGGKGGREG